MCVGEKLFRKSYICPLAKMAPEKANRAKSAGTNIIEGGYSHMNNASNPSRDVKRFKCLLGGIMLHTSLSMNEH